MGCFLGCFGSSKDDKKRTKNAQIASHRNQDIRNEYIPVSTIPTLLQNQEISKKPISTPVLESCPKQEEREESNLNNKTFCSFKQEEEHCKSTDKYSYGVKQEEKVESNFSNKDKPLEQLSLATRKRVTFASDVKGYKHISFNEPPEIVEESEKGGEIEVEESEKGGEIEVDESEKRGEIEVDVENNTKPINSSSVSEGGSTLSSLGSFPPNHRYGNCRESDDEDEELGCEVSDLDEDDEEEEEEVYDDDAFSDDEYSSRQIQEFPYRTCSSVESTKSPTTCLVDDAGSNHMLDPGSPESETKTPLMFNRGARDRAGYVHSVLNPVSNTAQWKSVKVKGTPPIKEQKENFAMDLSFQHSSSKSKINLDEPQNNNEGAVHASLSTWLVSSERTPFTKNTAIDLEAISSAASVSSHGSNSVKVQEERPILGALTVEELNQFSATSSPRRSPSRSPDERPLVGTVGVHWNDKTPADNTGSVSSFKGIPNTTSKYREDQRVNWHSTPFETRLERALNRDAVEGDASRCAC